MNADQLNRLAWLLDKLFSTADAITYLYSPQQTLNGPTPAQLIHDGHIEQVIRALDGAINGNYI